MFIRAFHRTSSLSDKPRRTAVNNSKNKMIVTVFIRFRILFETRVCKYDARHKKKYRDLQFNFYLRSADQSQK